MIDKDDASLYVRARNKDRIAFETLYDRYEKLLYSFAFRFTNDSALTEEVIQDVFLKLWNGTNEYDRSKGKFSSWLLTITRNRAIDEIRKRKRHTHEDILEKDSLVQDEASVEEKVEWSEQKSMVHRAMSRLKDDQHQMIDLFYFKGLSQQKISDQCEIPLGTVKGRIRIALKHLRKILDQEGGNQMNSEQCHKLIDYFNRSLTDKEVLLFEKHLENCSECRSELEELNSLTEELPYLSEPINVPKNMKARILEEIYNDDSAFSNVTEISEKQVAIQKKDHVKRPRFLMPTIAAALLLSLVTNAYLYNENKQYSTDDTEEIQPTTQVTLLPQQENNDAIAIASLLSEKGQNSILLQASNLPVLNEKEVYQVWVIEGDTPYPAGAFQTNGTGQGTLKYSLEDVEGKWDTIAITVEKEPNLPAPKGEIVLAGGI